MNELKSWLATQHFYAGVALLRKWIPGHEALRIMAQGPNAHTRMRLEAEIRALIREARPEPIAEEVKRAIYEDLAEEASTPEQRGGEWLYPEAIAEAIRERSKKVNARDKLSNGLAKEPSQELRAAMVNEMKALQESIAMLTEQIETWRETGKVTRDPSQPTTLPKKKKGRWKSTLTEEERAALDRQLRDLRSIQTKKKKAMEGWMLKTDDPTHPAKIEQYRIVLEQVTKQIAEVMAQAYE